MRRLLVRAVLALAVIVFALVACGSKQSVPPAAPVLTSPEQYASICKCDEASYCDLMVGAGAVGGTPATTGGCAKLPNACRGESDCACFGDLKGCRCSHTKHGFVTECPAP